MNTSIGFNLSVLFLCDRPHQSDFWPADVVYSSTGYRPMQVELDLCWSSTQCCFSTAHCHPSHQRRIVSSTSSRPSQSQSAWQRCSRMAHRRRQSLFLSSEFLASPLSLEQGYEFLHPSAEGLIQNIVPRLSVLQKITPALILPAFESQTGSLRVVYSGRDRSPLPWRVGLSYSASRGAHRLTQRRHLPPSSGLIAGLIHRRGLRSESLRSRRRRLVASDADAMPRIHQGRSWCAGCATSFLPVRWIPPRDPDCPVVQCPPLWWLRVRRGAASVVPLRGSPSALRCSHVPSQLCPPLQGPWGWWPIGQQLAYRTGMSSCRFNCCRGTHAWCVPFFSFPYIEKCQAVWSVSQELF